jgi:hypothetical protein
MIVFTRGRDLESSMSTGKVAIVMLGDLTTCTAANAASAIGNSSTSEPL